MVRLFGIKILDGNEFLAVEDELERLKPGHFSQFRKKYRNLTALQHSFFSDLLIRMLLSKRYLIRDSDVVLGYNDHNKPFLKNRQNLHFNVSHSGSWIVAAFSEKIVGIDIERVKKANLEVAHRYFSEEEVFFLDQIEESAKDEWFFKFWTIKESYLKAVGTGLTRPLSSFAVVFNGREVKLMDGGLEVDVILSQMDFDRDYKLAICSFGEWIEDNVEIISLTEILDFYKG
ncbi:MAG: 4'-phosphopantetheinyl transferase superfamily protein [Bacteroidales bacterium]|nr:4'-phosphopantetheinyl transferase superfamily protein [Bacteroidales bacterium]